MTTYVCTDHDTHWLKGCSVVVAADERMARRLLDAALRAEGLRPFTDFSYSLQEVPPDTALVVNPGELAE